MWVRIPLAWFLHKTTNFTHVKKLNKLSLKEDKVLGVNYINYRLNFKSIIAPSYFGSVRLLLNKTDGGRVLIKQSYLLLTWFTFISKTSSGTRGYRPKFFVKPLRRSMFTLVKAPMAHKTFSQEQYAFKSYSISISFRFPLGLNTPSPDDAFYLTKSVHLYSALFETNLFFLQKIQFTTPASAGDDGYFRLY